MNITELVIATVLYVINVAVSLYIFRTNRESNKSEYFIFTLCSPIITLWSITETLDATLTNYGYIWMMIGWLMLVANILKFMADFITRYNKNL
jgi:hypothetical protein